MTFVSLKHHEKNLSGAKDKYKKVIEKLNKAENPKDIAFLDKRSKEIGSEIISHQTLLMKNR